MSIPNWSFHNPVRIVFSGSKLKDLDAHVPYKRVALITSPGFRRRGIVDLVHAALGERLIGVFSDVKPNSDIQDIDARVNELRSLDPDALLALGGGSSIDTAKGLARLVPQPSDMTLSAHFTDGRAFQDAPALPIVAIPTTAGTGAEVTPFGTVWDFRNAKKYSVTGPDLYPSAALIYPELTLDLPADVTLSSGLDAISHALESAWNRNASAITLSLVAKSLHLSLSALPVLRNEPQNLEARAAMSQASTLAGMAISQTRTALAHSISYPLTSRLRLPHGVACSFTLPVLLMFNAPADDGRLLHLAHAVGYQSIKSLAEGLLEHFERLQVADLFTRYIPEPDTVMAMCSQMVTPGGRAENNLRTASIEDVAAIVSDSLQLVRTGYADRIAKHGLRRQ